MIDRTQQVELTGFYHAQEPVQLTSRHGAELPLASAYGTFDAHGTGYQNPQAGGSLDLNLRGIIKSPFSNNLRYISIQYLFLNLAVQEHK